MISSNFQKYSMFLIKVNVKRNVIKQCSAIPEPEISSYLIFFSPVKKVKGKLKKVLVIKVLVHTFIESGLYISICRV